MLLNLSIKFFAEVKLSFFTLTQVALHKYCHTLYISKKQHCTFFSKSLAGIKE